MYSVHIKREVRAIRLKSTKIAGLRIFAMCQFWCESGCKWFNGTGAMIDLQSENRSDYSFGVVILSYSIGYSVL